MKLTGRWVRGFCTQKIWWTRVLQSKEKWRREEDHLLPSSWVDVKLTSWAPPPRWAGEFSCPYVAKPRLSWHYEKIISGLSTLRPFTLKSRLSVSYYYIFYVCRERVLGVINFLSSPGRIWGSGHHCFIVWGHVFCFCCMVLLLSRPAWFCG